MYIYRQGTFMQNALAASSALKKETMFAQIPSRTRHLFIISAILTTTFLGYTPPAKAFKLKSHLMIANQAVREIQGQNEWDASMSFPSLGALQVQNPDVLRAVKANMGAFRAGVLGPDVFPDLYSGQAWVHVNNGNKEGLPSAECQGDCVRSDVNFETRTPFTKWRAIDYGMFLLKRAQAYNGDDGRDKAVAFAYGYLAHMAGDGFAHTYVNEWTRSVFDLLNSGKGEGKLFGQATGELQHIAVEGFIDAHIPKMDAESITIDPPLHFLKEVFMGKHGRNEGLKDDDAAAGAFGGRYFQKLLKARSDMLNLADQKRWGIAGVGQAIGGFATFGTNIGNPVNDIKSYFQQRADIIDAALDGWLQLSKCVAQNLVLGANQNAGERLQVDACASVDFEADPKVSKLFDTKLNLAAHFGKTDRKPDFGRTKVNLGKQRQFVEAVMNRFFVFDPIEDIASLTKIKDGIKACAANPPVHWATCNDACAASERICAGIVKQVACPRSICGSCEGFWGRGKCVLLGHVCLGCLTPGFEIVADEVCIATVRTAGPACAVCRPNPVCQSVARLFDAQKQIQLFTDKVIMGVLNPLITEMRNDLVEYYAGEYADEMYDLYNLFEAKKDNSTPAWFVNLAFLREDLQRDPTFLNDVINKMARMQGVVVDNGVSVAQAVASTITKTKDSGREALNEIVETTGVSTDGLWSTITDVIVSMARDPEFQPARDVKTDRFKALDQFKFREDETTYKSRLTKFGALIARLGGLMNMRGPTARALRASMNLDSGPIDSNAGSTFFSNATFEPVHNAIALTKLSFLGKPGLAALGSLGGVSLSGQPFGFTSEAFSGKEPSAICSEMSHPLCDSIDSLDDPNHYGNPIPNESRVNGGTTVHAIRSVALMESQIDAQGGGVATCVPGLSDFILSGTPQTVRKLYEKIFLMPKRCSPDLTVDMQPTFDGVPVVVQPGTIARASAGQSIDWVLRVRNLGVSPSMQSTVTLHINGGAFGTFTVLPIQPSGEQRVSAVLRTNTTGALRATATVDPSNQIVETREDNNSSSFTIHVH